MNRILCWGLFIMLSSGCSSRGLLPAVKEQPKESVRVGESQDLGLDANQLLLESEESVALLDDKLQSAKEQHASVETLEEDLGEFDTPSAWKGTLDMLNSAYSSRDTNISELSVGHEEEKAKVSNIQEQVGQNLGSLTADVQLRINNLQQRLNNLGSELDLLKLLIEDFDKQVKTELKEPIKLAQVSTFANTTPVESICNSTAIIRLEGRQGLFVDQVQLVCQDSSLDPVGGSGGTPAIPSACEDGEIARGIHGTSGDALDSVGLICAKASNMESDYRKASVIGNNTGSNNFEFYCPPRTALIGMTGEQEAINEYFVRLYPICALIESDTPELEEDAEENKKSARPRAL